MCACFYHTFVYMSASVDTGGRGPYAVEVHGFGVESATLPSLSQTGKGWYFQLFMLFVVMVELDEEQAELEEQERKEDQQGRRG